MRATIEAATVIQKPGTIPHEDVTCIFCGLQTPVPASGTSKFTSNFPHHISIVRCEVCGKEAPYPT